ncbi:MAG: hypothetical protein WC817_03800 [Patescibacteria group bacterium]|jgi:hypothetical protein
MPEREEPQILQPRDITPNAEKIVSPVLAEAIQREGIRPEGKDFSESEIVAMQEEIFRMQEGIDAVRPNTYHNAPHGREVTPRFEQLLPLLNLPSWQVAAHRLTPPFHDYGHSGRTLRVSDDGLSNEEFAAVAADEYAASKGFGTYQRILIQGDVIASTFGNPSIKPETPAEKAFALADVAGFIKPWEEWVTECAQVLAEVPEDERPDSVKSWLEGRVKFLQFCKTRLDEFSEIVRGNPEARKVLAEWEMSLSMHRRTVETLLARIGDKDYNRRDIIDGPRGIITPLLKKS